MEPIRCWARPTPMTTYPRDQHGIIRRSAALGAGISDHEITTDLRRHRLVRVYPGAYVLAGEEFAGHEGAQGLHRLASIAASITEIGTGTDLPLSHASAAALHGIPLLKPDIARVNVTTGRSAGGSIRKYRHIHAAPLDPVEVTFVDGTAVTTVERTAVDVACCGDFAQALTAFDHGLRAGGRADLMRDILGNRRRRGGSVARRALDRASPLSESVGESWSRAQMIEAGLPLPRLQHTFRCASGNYRTDFDWQGLVIGEFDGMVKYGRHLRSGESAAESVAREKRREDDLRGTSGAMVRRWTWADLERHRLVALVTPLAGALRTLGRLAEFTLTESGHAQPIP